MTLPTPERVREMRHRLVSHVALDADERKALREILTAVIDAASPTPSAQAKCEPPTCKRCGGQMLMLDGEWECHNVAPAIAPTPSAQAKCEGNGAPTHDAYHDSIGETK